MWKKILRIHERTSKSLTNAIYTPYYYVYSSYHYISKSIIDLQIQISSHLLHKTVVIVFLNGFVDE